MPYAWMALEITKMKTANKIYLALAPAPLIQQNIFNFINKNSTVSKTISDFIN